MLVFPHQPKYEDKVYKLLLLTDQLGQYCWVDGRVCSGAVCEATCGS